MEFKTLRNVSIPAMGIGTWGGLWGGPEREPIDPEKDKVCIQAIKSAIELGITHIDTAELYGGGHAEELIGQAIAGVKRAKLFITSKVSGTHLDYDSVISAAQGSLERLGIDYLDLYLVHWPDPTVPASETMAAMCDLVDKGLVKNIGVSNYSLAQMTEAQRIVSFWDSRYILIANQVEYNLAIRDEGRHSKGVESEVLPYCQAKDIFVIAYKPLARGYLARPGIKPLDEIAEKYGKTQAQIALNWLLSKKNVVTIPKTTNIEHMKENLGAIGWEMKKEDVVLLNQAEIPLPEL